MRADEMGRKGGLKRSRAKTLAARRNWRKALRRLKAMRDKKASHE